MDILRERKTGNGRTEIRFMRGPAIEQGVPVNFRQIHQQNIIKFKHKMYNFVSDAYSNTPCIYCKMANEKSRLMEIWERVVSSYYTHTHEKQKGIILCRWGGYWTSPGLQSLLSGSLLLQYACMHN